VPELPDVTIYVERLAALTVGKPIDHIRVASPFVLRTVSPSPRELHGAKVTAVQRLGKRIILGVEGDRFIVIHLMIAGRLRWKPRGEKVPGKVGLAAFDFPNGTLIFTEASGKKRASLHVVAGRESLAEFDRGGLDVLGSTTETFAERLRSERHTVKRALTDPTLFDGIGNAYSDEILHAAKLSPFRMTSSITDDEVAALHRACITTLVQWTALFRAEVGDGFPDGKYGAPCPVCGTKVQRIVYADNEANYCPTCQTEGRLLADRSLSRLLKEDWPKTLEELEERKRAVAAPVATKSSVKSGPATKRESAWTRSIVPTRAPSASEASEPSGPNDTRTAPSASRPKRGGKRGASRG
jgi:formamidopyrimidine-DNA glycosylase